MARTPRRVRIQRLMIGGALVLATAIATAAERTPSPSPSPSTASGSPGVSTSPHFRISGHVTGLYPGARTRLPLTLRNPNPYAIEVTRIRTSVQVPARSSCPARSIKVTRFTRARRIAPRAAVRVKVDVSMRAKAPNACAGQRYRLAYRGWATRA